MNFHKNIIDINKLSFFLVSLPYILFNFKRIVNSPLFNFFQLTIILLSIAAIDIIIKLVSLNNKNKILKTLDSVLLIIALFFFYGFYLTIFIQKNILSCFNEAVRGRSILLTLFILVFPFAFIRIKSFKNFNIFLSIFSGILVLSFFSKTELTKIEFKSNFLVIDKRNEIESKPIILMIADEYSSPDEIYKLNKDSSVYELSELLTKENWIVRNSFFSYETSTIHSLSSLFNFNLSKDSSYKKLSISEIGVNKLIKSKLSDSLSKKNISIINFGILDLGGINRFTRIYFYPTSLIEEFLLYSSYFTIRENTNKFKPRGLSLNYYPTEEHNKYIFSHISDSLNKSNNKKRLAYVHVYMPHSPMQFLPEFKYEKPNTFNYIKYWNFTNLKLQNLLKLLIKENKYRIIITGDHGYRGESRINPNFTFVGFYGFNEDQISKINSVQDLGSLIWGTLK